MQITLQDGSTQQYDDSPFATGGQGNLHLSADKQYVVKLYHEHDNSRVNALRKIINDYNITKKEDDQSVGDLFAWPDAIVKAPKMGVRMRNVNLRLDHKPLQWWIGAKAFQRLGDDIRGNWLDRTRIASSIARIAWKLHGSGLCHSDFSGNNFLANVNHQHVVLIDLDALVVPGVLPPEILGTGEYIAPEIVMAQYQGKSQRVSPSIYTDLHALAVLIYQLLLMRHPLKGPKQYSADAEKDDQLALGANALYIEDPDDTSNHPLQPFNGADVLGEEVEALMRRAFTVGLRVPTSRPVAAEWGDALSRLADQIIPCANEQCAGKAFVLLRDRPALCPWCKTKVPRPAQVPILRLYNGLAQAGHYQADKARIVGWQARTLHRWHTHSGVSEPSVLREARAPVAEIQYRGGVWTLVNHAISGLRVTQRNMMQRIEIGAATPLEHGQKILLGEGSAVRVAIVTMQSL